MNLTQYLNDYYYTKSQLAQRCTIDTNKFDQLIALGLLPQPAYSVVNNMEVCSYFGIEQVNETTDFYPRGYAKWIDTMLSIENISQAMAFVYFKKSYCQYLQDIVQQGLAIPESYYENTEDLIQSHWNHFLSGKYGVVTANGLIREIVETETIQYCLDDGIIDEIATEQIKLCIKLLDRSLSLGYDHEQKFHPRITVLKQLTVIK